MYRDDSIAIAIYDRARAWTRASFFLARLEEETRPEAIYFTSGIVMHTLSVYAGRELYLLYCDLEPLTKHPKGEVLLASRDNKAFPVERWHLDWTYVGGGIDPVKNQLKLEDRTNGIQGQLNRLRMRERIMITSVARQSWRAAPLMRPDHEQIAAASGVPASTVRSFFDGKRVSNDARDKILMAFNMLPEELEAALWVPGS